LYRGQSCAALRGSIEFGTYLLGLWDGHVRSLEKSHTSGAPLCVRICQSTIDGLPHHRRYRDATFARSGCDPLVAIIIDQYLKTMLK
jgi:hypothetical protein